ncbi:MAG: hypothetical protein QHC40_10270 [Sphingobium sp.]|nr:hypothetical protein [Sphingobium sp.]
MRSRRFFLLSMALAAAPAPAGAQQPQSSDDPLMVAYRARTQVVKPCDRSGGAIIVCGSRAERNARERLPLPRDPVDGAPPVRGEIQRASAAAVKQGSCGVVGGQGTGCVGGLPILGMVGLIGKAAQGLIDPDADLSPPPPLPERFRGAGGH